MTSQQIPDRISIDVLSECQVQPLHASLDVILEGESGVFGNEAFRQSKDVKQLLASLQNLGYSSENVSLLSVNVSSPSGKVLKSSASRLKVKLDKISLELLPKLMTVLAEQKNLQTRNVQFEFGLMESEKQRLLLDASEKAKSQAQALCKSLGVPLLGIYALNSEYVGPGEDSRQPQAAGDWFLSRARKPSEDDMSGLDFVAQQSESLCLKLRVDFRIGAFE